MEGLRFNYKGTEYRTEVTLGALRRFRKETGYDFVTERAGKLTADDMGVLLWATIKSGAKADGKKFDEELDDFLDNVTPEMLTAWTSQQAEISAEEEEDSDSGKKKN